MTHDPEDVPEWIRRVEGDDGPPDASTEAVRTAAEGLSTVTRAMLQQLPLSLSDQLAVSFLLGTELVARYEAVVLELQGQDKLEGIEWLTRDQINDVRERILSAQHEGAAAAPRGPDAGEDVQYDPAPERKGEIAARESLEPEAGAAQAGSPCAQNGLTWRGGENPAPLTNAERQLLSACVRFYRAGDAFTHAPEGSLQKQALQDQAEGQCDRIFDLTRAMLAERQAL